MSAFHDISCTSSRWDLDVGKVDSGREGERKPRFWPWQREERQVEECAVKEVSRLELQSDSPDFSPKRGHVVVCGEGEGRGWIR
ncbi:unnamed protein product [Effrenium voratum]|nr:unnamed protein product [Effrenium voratum]